MSRFATRSLFATFAALISAFPIGHLMAQEIASGDLRIVIIDGDGGVNIVKKKTAVKPVIEIRDKNDLPVAGAAVAFAAPD